MAKKNKEITTKIVKLDNKSRKGTYAYVKEKGKKGRYYKVISEEEPTIYKKYYEDKYVKGKQKGTIRQYRRAYMTPRGLKRGKAWKKYAISPSLKRQARIYLKEIEKRPTIHEAIKEGITQVTIKNIHKVSQKTIQDAQKDLLKDLIIDKNLINLVTTPENTKKLASRYENRIMVKDTEGKVVAIAVKYNTTPEQVINEIKNNLKQFGEEEYIEKKLGKMGYQTDGRSGKVIIGNIDMTIIFRKARQ